MPRLSGVDIPNEKRIDMSLTYLYGISRTNVYPLLEQAKIKADRRASTLTSEEVSRLQKSSTI